MKTTVNAVLINLSPEQESMLDRLQILFSSAVRFAYQRLLKGEIKKDIQKLIQDRYGLNSRYASDAIEQSRQLKLAQERLLNMQIENWQTKVKAAKKKIEKTKNPKQLPGLQAKLKKREKKLARWTKFRETGKLPKVIFGGRKNFIARCKGKLSQKEWQALRDNRLVSRGDVTKKGNPNTRLVVEDGKTYLIINTDQYETHGKVRRYVQIKAEVYLPYKLSKKTGLINGRNYRQMVLDNIQTGQPYQVEIIHKNGYYYCHITIEEPTPEVIFNRYNGLEGIDTNPDGLALTLISKDGNFKESCWLGNGELCNASSNRRNQIIGQIVKEAVATAKEHGVAIVIEDLKFKDNRDVRAKTGRKIHQFNYARLLEGLEREAIREGVEAIKVNPAYTSIIGRYKYQKQFGLTVHQAAAMVIARRGYKFRETLPKAVNKILPKKVKESNRHHWSRWYVANKTILKLRKAGETPAFSVV
jgi:IS605 OrfB family transposase